MGLWADILGTLGNTFAIGAKATRATITAASLTAQRTFTLPDAAGTFALTSDLSSYQPVDADLTLLAGFAWTGSTVCIGSGGVPTMLSIPVNTFLARSSAGQMAAKAISDDALSFVAASNYAAMRTALSVTTYPIVAKKMNWGGKFFNGTTSYLDTNALTGIADGKAGTIVCIVRFGNAATASETILHTTGPKFTFTRGSTGVIFVTGANAAGTTILSLRTSAAVAASAGTYVIMVSWDLAAGAGTARLWVNEVSDVQETTYTNDTIDYTVTEWAMGATVAGASFLAGDIYLMWFDATQRLDFNTESVRRKFTDPNGVALFLGRNGDGPTGTAPILFHAYDACPTWNFNRGSATSTWTVNGGNNTAFTAYQGEHATLEQFGQTVTITSTTYTVGRTDGAIINNSGATCTLTLPTASANRGRTLRVRNVGGAFATNSASSNVVPMAGGAAGTAILAATDGVWCELESTGTNWEIQKN